MKRIKSTVFIFIIIGGAVKPSLSAELYFDPNLINLGGADSVADLSFFDNGVDALPGIYKVDLYINDDFYQSMFVDFRLNEEKNKLVPCFSVNQLSLLDLNIDFIIKHNSIDINEKLSPINLYIPESKHEFNVGKQTLKLNIPQIYQNKKYRGYIPPSMWSEGINAAFLNYNFSANKLDKNDLSYNNYYLSLNSGINIGNWRFRDNSYWSYNHNENSFNSTTTSRWKNINTWLERDITFLKSRLYIGDINSESSLFESVGLKGFKISSSDDMLPDSMKGFAPVVRGVADGVSVVSIYQNGYEIYQTTVDAGPFEISDLYGGNNGDLTVKVRNQNGNEQVYIVPWSSLPLIQREGNFKYSLNVGKYTTAGNNNDEPFFTQAEAYYGLNNHLTLYGGFISSEKYKSFSGGIGSNLGLFGALSIDLTHAKSTLPNGDVYSGQSIHFLYNKSVNDYGTNLSLAGYRYSTKGFYDFSSTTYKKMSGYILDTQDGPKYQEPDYNYAYNLNYKQKGSFEINLSQNIESFGSLYLSGRYINYWNKKGEDKNFQFGYSSNYKGAFFSLNYSINKSLWATDTDKRLSFNMSLPISFWDNKVSSYNAKNIRFTYNTITDMNGSVSNQAGLNGLLGDDNQISFNARAGVEKNKNGQSSEGNQGIGSVSLTYNTSKGSYSGGYSRSSHSNNYFIGADGGIILHSQGITLSPYLATNSVLVQVPGAEGVNVSYSKYLKTDSNGFAVINYASPYRENSVYINQKTLPNNVSVENSTVKFVPTKGAISKVVFNSAIGYKLLASIKMNNKPIPFGSNVVLSVDGKPNSYAITGDEGLTYLTGVNRIGNIKASWGDSISDSCSSNYELKDFDENSPYVNLDIDCK